MNFRPAPPSYQMSRTAIKLLLAWLAVQFQGIHSFTLYLVGDFGRMFGRMNQALANISRKTVLEFADGFAQAAQRQVEFRSRSKDKDTLFAELTRQHISDSKCGKILLGGLSEDLRSIFEKRNQALPEKVAELTLDRIHGILVGQG